MFPGINDLKEKAQKMLLYNFQKSGRLWIVPSWPHYPDKSLWDSCFHAMVCRELGLEWLAKNELWPFFTHQHSNGFIPHAIFLSKKWANFSERRYYLNPKNDSNYTCPPVFAQAFEWLGDKDFAQKYFDRMVNFMVYLFCKQDPDKDNLISICHPHECGRDSSPEFDRFFNLQITPKAGWLKNQLAAVDRWKKILNLDKEYRQVNWDIEKIWKLNLFNVEDVMFNCIWVQEMRALARMKENKTPWLMDMADMVEKAIFAKMWDERDKFFYSLDANNQMIKSPSIAGLFPIILENIPKEMLDALVAHLTNSQEFWTDYPIPTVPVNHPLFDPGKYTTSCCWRGPSWINMNWFIIRGLVFQAKRFKDPRYYGIAWRIAQKNIEMVNREGFWEFYNPFTGRGLRIPNFGWSTLVVTYPRLFL